ncbi:MAG: porin [Rickettsiales bacterium]|nr:porin [Rickettsiales bacterium]
MSQSWAEDVFKVTGNSNIAASYSKQRSIYDNDSSVVNDSQIFLRAQNIINNDFKFGVIAKGEYILRSDNTNMDPNLDKGFLFARVNKIGNIEFGNVEAVNQKLKVGAASIAKGAGGINGKYLENINVANQGSFILLSQSPIGHGGESKSLIQGNRKYNLSSYRSIKDDSFDGLEDASKISYISNRINDIKFGFSYTPDVQDQGVSNSSNFNYDNELILKDIVSFGVNYARYIDNISIEISATGEYGNSKNKKDLLAYDAGIELSYFGFNIGFSYGSWGDSLKSEDNDNNCKNCSRPYYFSSGISYAIGPFETSITALNSNYYDNKFRSFALDFNYKLTKDLMTYFEITKFELVSNNYGISSIDSVTNNQGYVAMVGTLIEF